MVKWKKCRKCDRITLKCTTEKGVRFTNTGKITSKIIHNRVCIVCDIDEL